MNAQTAIAILRRHETALRARGVAHAAIFGSVARGDNRPNSDVDVLVEFTPGAEGTIFDYIRFKEYVMQPRGVWKSFPRLRGAYRMS